VASHDNTEESQNNTGAKSTTLLMDEDECFVPSPRSGWSQACHRTPGDHLEPVATLRLILVPDHCRAASQLLRASMPGVLATTIQAPRNAIRTITTGGTEQQTLPQRNHAVPLIPTLQRCTPPTSTGPAPAHTTPFARAAGSQAWNGCSRSSSCGTQESRSKQSGITG
jgi:hypothetical protein